ncbi:MAG TPA: nuclear transport factor 2 family protein [Thermoanaerobaculia bacterium]|nr:nuclear transport factor 2 family protein [Thermoanaerobaculia bacterium]
MRVTAISAVLFAVVVSVFAAEPPGSVREVEALERQLVDAIGRKDLATYDRIVADDYVVVDASGKDITKAEVMASYRDGTRGYTNLEIFDVRTHVFGDTAVVSARTKGLRREQGRDVPNDNRYVRVYARRGGRWRAVTQMSAPAAPPAR